MTKDSRLSLRSIKSSCSPRREMKRIKHLCQSSNTQSLQQAILQFQVEGEEIGKNWLSPHSRNIVEYRTRLYKAMELAQARYLERKNEKRVHNQRDSLVALRAKADFLTVNPRSMSLALEKRKCYKESRSTIRRVIERYFVIDNQLITFFENERDVDFKSNANLEGSFAFLEHVTDFDIINTTEWHDRTCLYRVQIGLPSRQLSPIYFYTRDLNEAKTLAARVQISSSTKKALISDSIRKISALEVIFRFQQIWRLMFKVYEKRLLKMISFQILGINLNELATTAWLQRDKLFKFWSGQVLKREKIPLLRSTFRFGSIKRSLDPNLYKSSLMVREQILKLVRAFKNRRLQRHSAIQKDIMALLDEEERGSECHSVFIQFTDPADPSKAISFQYSQANVKVESSQFLSVQNVQMEENVAKSVDFFEQNPPIKFQLEQVSCIATNFNMFDKGQQDYTVRVYGRVVNEVQDQVSVKNITPESLGLDVLRKIPQQESCLYMVKINSLELSIAFAKQFSLKADLRVKLRQGRTPEQLDRSFFINSRPYRISVPPEKQKGRMVLKGGDFYYLIDQLDQFNPEETFKITVVLQRNNVPVKQFMKEFLHEEELTSEKSFKYAEGQDFEVKCSDTAGNKVKVKFSVSKVPSANAMPTERDGLRLLVGRYVIYQKRIALLRQVNKDLTIDLQNLSTGTVKAGVKMKNVKMIEHTGVSVYNLESLPASVSQSQYAWVMEFKTHNKRIVNLISSGIQNKHTFNSFNNRAYSRDKKRDIEGRILLSLQEVLDLKIPDVSGLSLFVRITISKGDTVIASIDSPAIRGTSAPSWITYDNLNGYQIDLGSYFKEDEHLITLELINIVKFKPLKIIKMLEQQRSGETVPTEEQEKEVIIGSAKISTMDLIDIEETSKEKSIILTGSDIPFSFLIIHSLFVPSNVTRVEYQLVSDQSIFVSPEHQMHYLYLLKQKEVDQSNYVIPSSKFHPNYLESLYLPKQGGSPLLLEIGTTKPDFKSGPAISRNFPNILCSLEEQINSELQKKNILRPKIEEGILIFKYLWKHRIFNAKFEAYNTLQRDFWDKFLSEMSTYAGGKPFFFEIKDDLFLQDGDVALVDYDDKSYKYAVAPELHIPGEKIFDWLKKKAASDQPDQQLRQSAPHLQVQQYETKALPLMFSRIWHDQASQAYADTYYLIQEGIPSDQRVKIWRDLLKLDIFELEEQRVLRKKFNKECDPTKSVYQNYLLMAEKQDCLAFRQIDEDIQSYEFPQFYSSNLSPQERTLLCKEEKRKMRNIFKVLIMWSRNKKNEGMAVSFSYTQGLMHITQRLLTIASEEEAFWLLNGIVRMIPRLFSTDTSCLLGGRNSVMRNEMTAFKAVLRENLPLICDKLRILGLPVDYLIYDSLTSFYAHFFSSQVVLRLWDIIIFNLANQDKVSKKRALWQFMAPAYWILRERQDEILKATSVQEVIDVYNNGCSITYNPDWIVNDLKTLIKDIFVTGQSKAQTSGGAADRGNMFTSGFMRLMNRDDSTVQKTGEPSVDKAQMLEETRKQYEADLSFIFNQIEEENKQVGSLIEAFNSKLTSQTKKYLDYTRWRRHIMDRFKRVAIKKGDDQMVDNLYEFEEAVATARKIDLDLSKINIYLHNLQHLLSVRSFKLHIYYGNIADDNSFQQIEERFDEEKSYSTLTLDQFFEFEYLKGFNHIKIEIQDTQNPQYSLDLIIDLHELNSNRFIKRHYELRNDLMTKDIDSFKSPFPQLVASFFLQSHTVDQLKEQMAKRDTKMSQFIASIKRKLPDRIDIFNKKSEAEFIALMGSDFKRIIQGELQALQCFLPHEIALNTINDQFNYTESDFGNISLASLQYLTKQCFFSEWVPLMESVYNTFLNVQTKNREKPQYDGQLTTQVLRITEANEDEENLSDIHGEGSENANFVNGTRELMGKAEPTKRNSSGPVRPNLTGNRDKVSVPFSLRNFLVSLVLMSHCTITEKFDILYDLFDWNDGVADGLDMNSMFLLIKTIFERNLYYWPSHELFNLIEHSFDLSVSSVYLALWTPIRDFQNLHTTQKKRIVDLRRLLEDPSVMNASMSVDVTTEVQESLNSYQRMFGNKLIDFNHDSSAFKDISSLIKGGRQMLELTNTTGVPYKLVIMYLVSSERYQFEVKYDREGALHKDQSLQEKDDIDEYLKRNINKLYLQGRSKGISKRDFFKQTVTIPFFHDLVRVETFYRDRIQSSLRKKKKLSQELAVLLHEDEWLFVIRFQSNIMRNVEGELIQIGQNSFRILMKEANEEDCISDIRERMVRVFTSLLEGPLRELSLPKIMAHLKGASDFFVMTGNASPPIHTKEYDRLIKYASQATQGELLMRLEPPKHQSEDLDSLEEERDLAAFDCFSLYKHSDHSFEWRLCKIMQKEPIVVTQLGSQPQLPTIQQQQYYFWVEFLHHRKLGQKLWLKRRREEVLFSARYAREQQRNYQQETLKFIRETYKEAFSQARAVTVPDGQ